ncbi:MAG: hypothetical protein ACYC0H_09685, partial [Solirubrobacteraceae bacterium]
MLALVASATAVAAASLSLATPNALATGDANVPSCPGSTEASPGFRASLPDCRAYELVTQANSGDLADLESTYGFAGRFAFGSKLPTAGEGTRGGLPEQFLATRGSQGWQQTPLSVPQGSGPGGDLTFTTGGVLFTDGFADALVTAPWQNPLESPRLDETTGTMVYEIALASGVISTVSLPDSGTLTQSTIEFPASFQEDGEGELKGWGAFLAGASEDGSRIFFSTTAKFTTAPGTPVDTHKASAEVYERAGGHTYLVGVLPDGEVPVCGAEVGQGDNSTAAGATPYYAYDAIAPSGANVVFHTPAQDPVGAECTERETGLFLRDTATGTTSRLPGAFYAGRAGTRPSEEETIFTVEPVAGLEGKILAYHVAAKQTVEVASEAEGLLAYSASGARVYYLGPEGGIFLYEAGAPAARLVPGTQSGGYTLNNANASGIYGSYISASHSTGALVADGSMPATTADGGELMFLSSDQLTQYQNCTESEGSEQCHVEAYLYSAASGAVTCVSCGAGSAPHGNAALISQPSAGPLGSSDWVPPAPPLIDSRPAEDGKEAVMRVVFQTTEGLVPGDANGTWDVYEWEQEGTEGCSLASLKVATLAESLNYSAGDRGCLYLLTSGAGRELELGGNREHKEGGSHLLGASEGLADVYIETVEDLTEGAVDNVAHVY